MRLLDLFSGSGGAAMGYHRAGFTDIVGVDLAPMPRYPFDFAQGDALEYLAEHGDDFDAVHASPPCQWVTHASIQWRSAGKTYPALVDPTRDLLLALGRPYVIEQPVGWPLRNPVMLNGAQFGLRVRRVRYFETSFEMPLVLLPGDEMPAKMGRPWDARKGQVFYPVGHFSGVAEARVAMGIDWYMTQREVAQAIPPAYCEFIGKHLLDRIRALMGVGSEGRG